MDISSTESSTTSCPNCNTEFSSSNRDLLETHFKICQTVQELSDSEDVCIQSESYDSNIRNSSKSFSALNSRSSEKKITRSSRSRMLNSSSSKDILSITSKETTNNNPFSIEMKRKKPTMKDAKPPAGISSLATSNTSFVASDCIPSPPPETVDLDADKYQCPICHKWLSKGNRFSHIKKCAVDNKVTPLDMARLTAAKHQQLEHDIKEWEVNYKQKFDEMKAMEKANPTTFAKNSRSVRQNQVEQRSDIVEASIELPWIAGEPAARPESEASSSNFIMSDTPSSPLKSTSQSTPARTCIPVLSEEVLIDDDDADNDDEAGNEISLQIPATQVKLPESSLGKKAPSVPNLMNTTVNSFNNPDPDDKSPRPQSYPLAQLYNATDVASYPVLEGMMDDSLFLSQNYRFSLSQNQKKSKQKHNKPSKPLSNGVKLLFSLEEDDEDDSANDKVNHINNHVEEEEEHADHGVTPPPKKKHKNDEATNSDEDQMDRDNPKPNQPRVHGDGEENDDIFRLSMMPLSSLGRMISSSPSADGKQLRRLSFSDGSIHRVSKTPKTLVPNDSNVVDLSSSDNFSIEGSQKQQVPEISPRPHRHLASATNLELNIQNDGDVDYSDFSFVEKPRHQSAPSSELDPEEPNTSGTPTVPSHPTTPRRDTEEDAITITDDGGSSSWKDLLKDFVDPKSPAKPGASSHIKSKYLSTHESDSEADELLVSAFTLPSTEVHSAQLPYSISSSKPSGAPATKPVPTPKRTSPIIQSPLIPTATRLSSKPRVSPVIPPTEVLPALPLHPSQTFSQSQQKSLHRQPPLQPLQPRPHLPIDSSTFSDALQSLLSDFKVQEQKAEDDYYAAIGRITVQKEKKIHELCTLHAVQYTPTLSVHSSFHPPQQAQHHPHPYHHHLAPPREVQQHRQPQSIPGSSASQESQPVSSTLSINRNVTKELPPNNPSSSNKPDFGSMSSAQLSSLATKFGIRPTLPRGTLIRQLESIWAYYASGGGSDSGQSSLNDNSQHLFPASQTSMPADTATRRNHAKQSSSVAISNGGSLDPNSDISKKIDQFIKGDISLYSSILQYEPLDLAEFQAKLKAAKIRCSRAILQDYLQSRSILFTSKKIVKSSSSFTNHR